MVGNRSKLPLLMELLRQRRQRPSEQAFALALVVLAALMLTAGGLALANRSSQGLLGSVYLLFGLQAREAAEIGVTRIVTELNKPQNRELLRARGTSTETTPWQTSDLATFYRSKCPPLRAGDVPLTAAMGELLAGEQRRPLAGGPLQLQSQPSQRRGLGPKAPRSQAIEHHPVLRSPAAWLPVEAIGRPTAHQHLRPPDGAGWCAQAVGDRGSGAQLQMQHRRAAAQGTGGTRGRAEADRFGAEQLGAQQLEQAPLQQPLPLTAHQALQAVAISRQGLQHHPREQQPEHQGQQQFDQAEATAAGAPAIPIRHRPCLSGVP
jgi:hypothetical protein